jgi:hypothetical protein
MYRIPQYPNLTCKLGNAVDVHILYIEIVFNRVINPPVDMYVISTRILKV